MKSKHIYIDLFLTFLKIGTFTIGGGYAMIPLIEKEVVENKKWIEKEYFLDLLSLAQSAPGVMAINTSIFVGYKLRGFKGALASSLGTIFPSFIIILFIASYFVDIKNNTIIEKMFNGMRPAVVALIAGPVWKLSKVAKMNKFTIFIPLIVVFLVFYLKISPVYVVISALFIGVFLNYLKKNL